VKEFITAVEDVAAQDEREEKIKALIEQGKSREDAEAEVDGDEYVEFKVDDRVLRAYQPTDGQLAFMLAALGRGQSKDQRFASIINIMLASLRDDDQDYLEGRLLDRDPKNRLKIEMVESIFEYLTEEWFARPTQSPSGSAPSLPSGGQN
jgi:hypothetical protein